MKVIRCHFCSKEVPYETKIYIRDECPFCKRDLHICLNCEFYDEGAYHQCREPQAEQVFNKEKANVCEFFTPSSGKRVDNKKEEAKKRLDELFKNLK
jgi:phage FluMu protein Com